MHPVPVYSEYRGALPLPAAIKIKRMVVMNRFIDWRILAGAGEQ